MTTSTETITWQHLPGQMPDADSTVLVCLTDDTEPTWPGFFDGEDWRCTTSGGVFAGTVTKWAEMPTGGAPC